MPGSGRRPPHHNRTHAAQHDHFSITLTGPAEETALKLQELVKSEEIKALPENDQLHVLDQVSDLIKELEASTTDKGKVHRGLKRLGDFLSQVASSSIEETIAQAAIAYAAFYGILPT